MPCAQVAVAQAKKAQTGRAGTQQSQGLAEKKNTSKDTLPETNIAPENRPSQKESSTIFRGYVKLREGSRRKDKKTNVSGKEVWNVSGKISQTSGRLN